MGVRPQVIRKKGERPKARRADEQICPDCRLKRRVRDDLRKLDALTRGKILGALAMNASVSAAAKQAGVSRAAVYKDAQLDKSFAEEMTCAKDNIVDLAEMKAFERVRQGSWDAIRYVLETRGRSRGYGVHQEVDATVRNVEWIARIGDDDIVSHQEQVH